ncbi:MAG: DNA replication protein [Pseudomonadota bacterium]
MKFSKQLPLDFDSRPARGREDFFVTKSHAQVLARLDAWPHWVNGQLAIFGPALSGKSHLASVHHERLLQDPKLAVRTSWVEASNLKDTAWDALGGAHIVLDGVDDKTDAQSLFHLLNWQREHNGSLLITSREAPARIAFPIADLCSRLRGLDAVSIREPDEDLFRFLLLKHLSDFQVDGKEALVSFLALRTERTYAAAYEVVRIMYRLAFRRRSHKLTVPLAKEALSVYESERSGVAASGAIES